jgi:hypothetical protein
MEKRRTFCSEACDSSIYHTSCPLSLPYIHTPPPPPPHPPTHSPTYTHAPTHTHTRERIDYKGSTWRLRFRRCRRPCSQRAPAMVTRYRTCTGITSTFLIVRIACRNDTHLEDTRLTARAIQHGSRTFAASGLLTLDSVIANVVIFRHTSTLLFCALQNNFSSVVMFSVFQRSFSTKFENRHYLFV